MREERIEKKFLDYLEGRLSKTEQEKLAKLFESDPQLKRAFDEYRLIASLEDAISREQHQLNPSFSVRVMEELDKRPLGRVSSFVAYLGQSRALLVRAATLATVGLALVLVEKGLDRPAELKMIKAPKVSAVSEETSHEKVADKKDLGEKHETKISVNQMREDNFAPVAKSVERLQPAADSVAKDIPAPAPAAVPEGLREKKSEQNAGLLEKSGDDKTGAKLAADRIQVLPAEEARDKEGFAKEQEEEPLVAKRAERKAKSFRAESAQDSWFAEEPSYDADSLKAPGEDLAKPSVALGGQWMPEQGSHSSWPRSVDEESEFKSGRVRERPLAPAAREPVSSLSSARSETALAVIRQSIERGVLPSPGEFRVEDLINAFHYDYRQVSGSPLSLDYEVAPSPFEAGVYLLRLGFKLERGARERGIEIETEFNSSLVRVYRLFGYEGKSVLGFDRSRNAFDLRVLAAADTLTILYQITLNHSPRGGAKRASGDSANTRAAGSVRSGLGDSRELALLRVRTETSTGLRLTIDEPILVTRLLSSPWQASESFRFAAGAAYFGQFLKGKSKIRLSEVERVLDRSRQSDSDGKKRSFVELVKKAKNLRRP